MAGMRRPRLRLRTLMLVVPAAGLVAGIFAKATMGTSSEAVRDWYTNQLREHLVASYRAARAFDRGEGDDPESVCPRDTELGPSATRAERAGLPQEVREAYEFYKGHFEDADIGSARDYVVSAGGKKTYAIRVRTDGDDGYLEIYDESGRFLAAGRTYLEVVAWGSRAWLRAQAAQPGGLPPELQDAPQRTLWGKPLPD